VATVDLSAWRLAEADRSVLASWLDDFERSWNEGRLSARVRELPTQGNPLRRAALVEMVKIDLERRWQAGRRVLLDAYLKSYPELGTPETVPVELILHEWQVRKRFGSTSAVLADYSRRFPAHAAELARREATLSQAATLPPPAKALPGSDLSRETRSLRSSTRAGTGPATPASLPEHFGRYRILKPLGKGGMGSVYLAHDSQLDRQVALKVPHFTQDDGPDVLERFAREARAAAALSHPNICPVYDVGAIDGVHFVTMAYVPGRTLAELLEGGKALPGKPAAAVVRKLALALAEAHKHGIIHRDLKPSNVLVNKRNEPVVTDFGLARRMGKDDVRVTRSGSILGTPAYMSPEQVGGDSQAVGSASDVYSLGVILYEMLTGQLPFQGPTAAVLGQILTQEPPPPRSHCPDLDPALEAICLKAMAKKPEGRYRGMEELAAALGRYLKGQEEPPPPPDKGAASRAKAPVAIPVAVAAGSSAGNEGLATELLARLVDRLDAPGQPPQPAPPPPAPSRSVVWPMLAAVALMGAVIVAMVIFLNKPGKTEVKTTVSVRLEGFAAVNDPTVVNIFLDDKKISKEDLAGDLNLVLGEHTLVVKRKDGTEETISFEVSGGDDDKPPQVAVISPPPPEPPAPDVFPVGDSLPMKATWHIAALKKDFHVEKASYDAGTKKLSLLVRAKRNFGRYVGGEVRLHTRFYDADDSRVHDAGLRFQPDENVKRGDKLEVFFYCPAEEVSRKTKRVLVLHAEDKEFPAGLATPRKPIAGHPADKIAWDLEPLRKHFDILGVNYDEEAKHVYWLLQARQGFRYVGGAVRLHVRYYDGDDARQDTATLYFLPDHDVLKGERIRLRVWVPPVEVRARTKRALLLTPEDNEFKIHPGPALKPVAGHPKDKIAWDLKPLQPYFDILGVNYDEEAKHVYWLLQARQGFRYVGGTLNLQVRYYDAVGKRLEYANLYFLPDHDVLKGERIRLRVFVPPDEVRKKTTKALLEKP
jgi:serine/threonine protein kinase